MSQTIAMRSTPISIPEDNIAKLMYYINAVHNCVDIKISDRLMSYRNVDDLTEQDKRDVVAFVHRYRPSALRNVIFFEVDDRSYMLPTTTNNFLDFQDPVVIGSFNLPSNLVMVDGVQHIIRRVMIFKRVWMSDFFIEPFEAEKWRINLAPRPKTIVKKTRHQSHAGNDVAYWLIGGVFCCLILPPVGLALCCVACCRYAQEQRTRKQDAQETTAYVVY